MSDRCDIPDWEIALVMIRLGGSFVQHLGHLYGYADEMNRQRLINAFPELWDEYRDLAIRIRERDHA